MNKIEEYFAEKESLCQSCDTIDRSLYGQYGVKAGLRDESGSGVVAGITNISQVLAFKTVNGETVPCDGKLLYRGYSIQDLIKGSNGNRFAFEEVAYLLIFGKLPDREELQDFCEIVSDCRTLPTNFTRDIIMKAPSKDVMNSMTKSILSLGAYDERVNDLNLDNVIRQCVQLMSIFPMLAIYGYHAYNHYEKDQSMYIHRPDPNMSTAENFLRMLRPDTQFSELEARALDVALLLHAEHGGGNNSTFTTRVVTSSGTDTYSAMAAAMCSLKGPRHGGANIKVMRMMDDIRAHIGDYADEEEIAAYLSRILDREAYDRQGLIYGMGHAVYSLSDPREVVFKGFVERLAKHKGREQDLLLYSNIEKVAPRLIAEKRKIYKGVSPNVDFYSGFVYEMMGIPEELFTPLFAIARIAGWSAHRIEEMVSANKIIRPAYKSICTATEYVGRDQRKKQN